MNAVKSLRVSVRRVGTLVTSALLVALTTTGCGGTSPAPSAPKPTPIQQMQWAKIDLPRIKFCALVPEATVAKALGLTSKTLPKDVTSTGYSNGDEIEINQPPAHRVQEIGCRWSNGTTSASAWVFARAVDPAFAREVVSSVKGAKQGQPETGCTTSDGALGSPSYSQSCVRPQGNRTRMAGLIGQTWFSCQIEGAGDLAARTEQWCVTLAADLDAS